ncbi:MAG: sulfotransferase [Pseudomonadota bacterium]|nr:sulfotransferase [Pseudomonadota bacterium]
MATRLRVTSRDYSRPARGPTVRALHASWHGVGASKWPVLDAESLLDAARRAEGLDDFGDPAFHDPLARLIDATEAEARLHPVGRVITRTRLVTMLRNRLRAEAWFKDHPEILQRPIVAPIVITGLPRTGTTFLQRLLSADPRTRSMLSWEGANPAPLRGRGAALWDTRRVRAGAIHKVIAGLAPDFLACHPIERDGVDEEIILLDHSLLSSLPEVMMHVPTYARWQEAQSQAPAYQMLRRLLLLLDWQRAGQRWLLKTPQHLECLDDLFAVFPDACVVHVHRDPMVSVASTCSMVAHARGFVSDSVDPAEVGRSTLDKLDRMMTRMAETRAQRGGERFVDVYYDDLIASPVAEARRVLEATGLEWTPAAEAAVTGASLDRERDRFGRHVYALEDFALAAEEVRERFAEYRERFELAG